MFLHNNVNVLNEVMDNEQEDLEDEFKKDYEAEESYNEEYRRMVPQIIPTTTEKVTIPPPQLTWIKVQKLSPEIALNLAKFGTPYLGGSRKSRKSRKSNFNRRGYTKKSQIKHLGWIQ